MPDAEVLLAGITALLIEAALLEAVIADHQAESAERVRDDDAPQTGGASCSVGCVRVVVNRPGAR